MCFGEDEKYIWNKETGNLDRFKRTLTKLRERRIKNMKKETGIRRKMRFYKMAVKRPKWDQEEVILAYLFRSYTPFRTGLWP